MQWQGWRRPHVAWTAEAGQRSARPSRRLEEAPRGQIAGLLFGRRHYANRKHRGLCDTRQWERHFFLLQIFFTLPRYGSGNTPSDCAGIEQKTICLLSHSCRPTLLASFGRTIALTSTEMVRGAEIRGRLSRKQVGHETPAVARCWFA